MQINKVANKKVFDFKEQHCNENEIIVEIIKKELLQYFKAPILDVGSGIGDIAYKALKDKKTILIDVNAISKHDYPCRPEHIRKKADFLDYHSKDKINTIFISHTLQFIDDDIVELNEKIKELNPEFVITVLNSNNDFMGELIEWTEENYKNSNPEVRLQNFPISYNLIKTIPFKAEIKCKDFRTLAKQVSYLMLIDLKEHEAELISFLKGALKTPNFIFNQSIDVHHKK
jgi:ubiquinone/menaquinone biosynthesis C-methylase UbiE